MTATDYQSLVRRFHETFDLTINDKPTVVSLKDAELRSRLITEEHSEFRQASQLEELVEIADAIGDLLYVVFGAAVTYGIDAEAVFLEVHRSNMSKLRKESEIVDMKPGWTVAKKVGDRYVVKDANGKAIKSPSYSPADIKGVIGV